MASETKPKKKIKRRRVRFTLEVPKAKESILMGDFNNWNAKAHPMNRSERGVWEKIVILAPGRYEYKFLVDGQWLNDPKNGDFCRNSFGTQNNVVIIPRN